MADIRAFDAPQDENLLEFSRLLWQQRIPHRLVESGDRQVLWVGQVAHVAQATDLYRRWQRGETPALQRARPAPPASPDRWLLAVLRAPVTALLLLLSVAGFLLVELDPGMHWVKLFTFFEFERIGDHWVFVLPQGEYWRMFTPVFLHFSLLHITFNMLWWWDLGRRIEVAQGSVHLGGIVLSIGMGSNIVQFMFSGASVFGGMSGVIYGLLGYCWIWSRMTGDQRMAVPGPVMAIMLGWLLLCMAGFAALLGAGAVANAAHVGGLMMGLLLGGAAALFARSAKPR
ncbi:MAG: rhomboid family intramembrane serine protease [Spongiibacteraceae bacterium]|jgi:GlpG protein|nr:rhomboid family intramembrane serine protease [Spongiibacteraceae bacterium]